MFSAYLKPLLRTVMNLRWKLFRFVCILQMILAACQVFMYIAGLFAGRNSLYNLLVIGIFCIMVIFIYQGLSILNYNYPDTPLTVKQKRAFNWLFLFNFLLIAFLFARVVNDWWVVPFLFDAAVQITGGLFFLTPFLFSIFIFVFHLILLTGFYMLRRTIHQRTIAGWYQQFEANNP
jgi:hypothetical protein